MRHLDQRNRKRLCVRVVDPRKQHVSVYKKAQAILSWLLPVEHEKRRVGYISKHWLVYFSYTETLTRMRGLLDSEIRFTSMDAIFKRS